MKKNLKLITLVVLSLVLIFGVKYALATTANQQVQPTSAQRTESDKQIFCTKEYNPVCGEKQVQCIKAPCPPIRMNFGNKCELMAAGAKYLGAGTCEKLKQEQEKKNQEKKSEDYYKNRIKELEKKVMVLEKENNKLKVQIKKIKAALSE